MAVAEPPAELPAEGHSAVLHDGALIIYGGKAAASGNLIGTVWRAEPQWAADEGDPAGGSHVAITPLAVSGAEPRARCYHAAAASGGQMYVVHGLLKAGDGEHHTDPGALPVLDLETAVWSALHTCGTPPGPRCHHAAAIVGGELYVAGGYPLVPEGGGSTASAGQLFALDLVTLVWTMVTPLGVPGAPQLWGHTLVPWDDKLVLYGGVSFRGGGEAGALWVWHCSRQQWREVRFGTRDSLGAAEAVRPPQGVVRALWHWAAEDSRQLGLQPGDVVELVPSSAGSRGPEGWLHGRRQPGGQMGWFPGNYVEAASDVAAPVLCPSPRGAFPPPRSSHAACGVAGWGMLIWGGERGDPAERLSDVWLLDLRCGAWLRVAAEGDVPPPAAGLPMVWHRGTACIVAPALRSLYLLDTEARRAWRRADLHPAPAAGPAAQRAGSAEQGGPGADRRASSAGSSSPRLADPAAAEVLSLPVPPPRPPAPDAARASTGTPEGTASTRRYGSPSPGAAAPAASPEEADAATSRRSSASDIGAPAPPRRRTPSCMTSDPPPQPPTTPQRPQLTRTATGSDVSGPRAGRIGSRPTTGEGLPPPPPSTAGPAEAAEDAPPAFPVPSTEFSATRRGSGAHSPSCGQPLADTVSLTPPTTQWGASLGPPPPAPPYVLPAGNGPTPGSEPLLLPQLSAHRSEPSPAQPPQGTAPRTGTATPQWADAGAGRAAGPSPPAQICLYLLQGSPPHGYGSDPSGGHWQVAAAHPPPPPQPASPPPQQGSLFSAPAQRLPEPSARRAPSVCGEGPGWGRPEPRPTPDAGRRCGSPNSFHSGTTPATTWCAECPSPQRQAPRPGARGTPQPSPPPLPPPPPTPPREHPRAPSEEAATERPAPPGEGDAERSPAHAPQPAHGVQRTPRSVGQCSCGTGASTSVAETAGAGDGRSVGNGTAPPPRLDTLRGAEDPVQHPCGGRDAVASASPGCISAASRPESPLGQPPPPRPLLPHGAAGGSPQRRHVPTVHMVPRDDPVLRARLIAAGQAAEHPGGPGGARRGAGQHAGHYHAPRGSPAGAQHPPPRHSPSPSTGVGSPQR
eukprot:TRINITY_DN21797_c0_g1_i1.p1 TRINITY_DN21797_c0_g1~~TRINITY_DN21797_c0_g1_i1.p1  ORF type:complete len:1119 (+),score=183.44 TRINITY_DN21797_c0_g1_i1:124-3357(+)